MTITATSLVTRPLNGWKWQDRYGVNTYAPFRTTRGIWVWRRISEGQDIASVGRDRRTPDVETDWVGKLHNVRLVDGPQLDGAVAKFLKENQLWLKQGSSDTHYIMGPDNQVIAKCKDPELARVWLENWQDVYTHYVDLPF